MELNVIEEADNLTHLVLVGRLDLAGVQKVELAFVTHTGARRKDTIVDVSQMPFVASLGLGMLLNAAKSLHRHHARLILVGAQEMVLVALKAAHLTDLLEVADTVDDAKAMLNGDEG